MAESTGRRVLLLGEGDFSFAAALATSLRDVTLTPTSVDGEAEVMRKYGEARGHLRRLHLLGVSAAHRVDATRLHSADARFGAAAFDDVVFTHPHLGTEDVHAHHSLLAHFFASLKQADLRVAHVTLAASQPEAWDVVGAAARHGFELIARSEFVDAAFPRYVRRRSLSTKSFRSRSPPESTTLTFATHDAPPFRRGETLPWTPLLQRHANEPPQRTAHTPTAAEATAATNATADRDADRCDECGRDFEDARALRTHVRHVHTLTRPDQQLLPQEKRHCEACDRAFGDAEALRQHKRSRHQIESEDLRKPDWFEKRDDATPPPNATRGAHTTTENAHADGMPECQACGLRFADALALGRHLRPDAFVPKEPERPQCPSCARDFADARALQQHVLGKHPAAAEEAAATGETRQP